MLSEYVNPQLQHVLQGADINHLGDNMAANGAMYKGYFPAPDIAKLVCGFHLRLARLGARVWIEYVASAANIADLPSRGEFGTIEGMGATRIPFVFPTFGEWGGN